MMKNRRNSLNLTMIVEIKIVVIIWNILMICHLIKQLRLMKLVKMFSRIIKNINRLIKTNSMMVITSNKHIIILYIKDKDNLSINQWHFITAKLINKMNQARIITLSICRRMIFQSKWIWIAKIFQFLSKELFKILN